MGDDNPNAEVEANLLIGESLYASAGSALQQVKSDLDALAAGLQPAWIGAAYDAYMQKQSQLAKAVQAGSDVMQKGSVEIRKMYDAYMQADEKMREAKRQAEAEELFMDVLMIITALLGVVGPFLELADLAFEAGMEAIDETVTVVSDVTEDVVDDTETLVDVTELGDDTETLVDVTEFEDDTETLVDVTEFEDPKTKLEEILYGKTTGKGPDEFIAPQEPVTVYRVEPRYDEPISEPDPETLPGPEITMEIDADEPEILVELLSDGTERVTELYSDGTEIVTEIKPNGITIRTQVDPDETITKTGSSPTGDGIATINKPNGDKIVMEIETVNNPATGNPTQIRTVTRYTTNSEGEPTVDMIVEDPVTNTTSTTRTVIHADGNQSVTEIATDLNGQNPRLIREETIPPPTSTAGPSTEPIPRPPKRSLPDDPQDPGDPGDPGDPDDPKGKKVKRE